MKVVSLFDGMSCGQIALNRSGIRPEVYFASEIKKHAIGTTQLNFPETKQMGSVTDLKSKDLGEVDLLIGGSPCQDFSRANKERDGLDGEKSGLFFEYVRIFEDTKPKFFLLENVVMEAEDEAFISEIMGTRPVRINSERVSAQLRDRLYWTNIGPANFDLFGGRTVAIPQPKDRGITLQSILTEGYTDREKSRALLESDSRPLADPQKMFYRYAEKGFTTIVFDSPDFDPKKGIRYFNQTELERLQTVPEGYTKSLSRNLAACLLGDGWTVDVISHIFNYLPQ